MAAFRQADDLVADSAPSLAPAARGIGAFVLVYLIGRFLIMPAVIRMARARNPQNPTVVQAVDRYARTAIVLAAVAIAITAAGYGRFLTGSAVVIAAVTLAIGVAGQEVIGNLVSGLFLVTDPDFNVDDWIEWDDGEGVVETIRFRVTRVRTPNNEVITVPNTVLATNAVTRPYSRDHYRIVVRLGVSFDDDVDDVTAILRDELETGDAADDPPPTVELEELGDDAVEFRVQFWIENPTRRNVVRARSNYVRRVKDRLETEGITVSPPSEHELSGRIEIDREESR